MKYKQLLIVTIFIFWCGSVPSLRAQLPPSYAMRLQHVLDSVCSKYHIKGASAAIYVPGRGTWKGTYGISFAGNPITSDMAFPLNSNTKTYTAALMLRLQEQGVLQLSDTIGKWIQNKPNINGQVTIRQLLNHTSGIYNYTDNAALADSLEADLSRVWQPLEMLPFVGPPVFAPGAGWEYSNTNYLLAGMIIAQVSAMPVEQAMRSKMLVPAGLANTWFYPQERPSAIIPHFWFDTGAGLIDGTAIGYTPESFYSSTSSAGALFGTAEDNVQFWHKMIAGQVLSASSLTEWRRMVYLNSTTGYGLGIFRYNNINGHVVYRHGGTAPGAINENLADSVSGVCISLLTNQDSADNNTLFNGVVKALHRVTIDMPTAVAEISKSVPYNIYPNPAQDILHIDHKEVTLQTCNYAISDVTGKVFLNGLLTGRQMSIPLAGLQNGLYYLHLSDHQGKTKVQPFSVLK